LFELNIWTTTARKKTYHFTVPQKLMDPLSIASACVALAASIGKVSVQINDFCRQVRDARRDLDLVTRELGSLKTTLDILADDIKDPDHAFPSYLGKQIFDLVANCNDVVEQVRQLLNKYEGGGLRNGTRWALSGREDMNKLRVSLEAHKSALELALEVITLCV
jgi:hypothetical protein